LPQPENPWKRWLIPDLAFTLSTIMTIYCLTSFAGMQSFFRDSDAGWHIRNGEKIVATGAVPVREPYSFSKPGGDWYAWEWLADVTMGLAHRWDGARGVFFLYLAVLAVVARMWFELCWTCGVWFLPAVVGAWIMLTTSTIHWLARPHLYGWLFLLAAVLLAETASNKRKAWWMAGVAALGVLWANMHASFFLGVAIFGLYACEAFVRRETHARTLALWAGLLAATSFVNPYGWRVHEHIVRYLGDTELLAKVGEFQSFNFHIEGAQAIVLAMLIAAAGAALNAIDGRWARAVLSAVLFVGALRSARGLPLVALVAVPMGLGAMCHAVRGARASGRWAEWRDGFARYNDNLRLLDMRFRGWALAPIVFAALVFVGRSPLFSVPAGFQPDVYPVRLSDEIAKLPAAARLFSSDKFGGYLIYRFDGERKVFFDGRSDYYGAKFLNDYLLIPDAKPGWEAQWAKWNFTHALVPKDSAISLWLPVKGWKKIGEDKVALLYERGGG
jgi:hypothetical protein